VEIRILLFGVIILLLSFFSIRNRLNRHIVVEAHGLQ